MLLLLLPKAYLGISLLLLVDAVVGAVVAAER